MNRHQRRRDEARQRAQERRLQKDAEERAMQPNQLAALSAQDRKHAHDGIATLVRAVKFQRPDHCPPGGGECLFRSLIGLEVLRQSKIDARLEVGSMLYRVGPDPFRDVIAFCGQANTGIWSDDAKLFHVWLAVHHDIVDFSVGDWRTLENMREITIAGAPRLGPIQWTIAPPNYWWKPRAELATPWRSSGTPELGQCWYGPIKGDLRVLNDWLTAARRELSADIHRAVTTVFNRASDQLGVTLEPAPLSTSINPAIIQSQVEEPPPGYHQTTFGELFRIAGGAPLDPKLANTVAYVTHMPTSREEALELFKHMSITLPPGAQ
jgi:hypothetical protein